jgi:hypothetical protein
MDALNAFILGEPMKTSLISLVAAVAALGHGSLSDGADSAAAVATAPFYAQACFCKPDPRYPTLTDQIKLLAALGFDGYSHFGLEGLPEASDRVSRLHDRWRRARKPHSHQRGLEKATRAGARRSALRRLVSSFFFSSVNYAGYHPSTVERYMIEAN